jgi:hypothetical protein
MARFDVYANPGSHATTTPYLLDVQSDLLDGLDTRMVIPLRRLDAFPKVKLSTRPPMATSNSPTRGHPKFPQARRPDYDGSGLMARRAAASLRR